MCPSLAMKSRVMPYLHSCRRLHQVFFANLGWGVGGDRRRVGVDTSWLGRRLLLVSNLPGGRGAPRAGKGTLRHMYNTVRANSWRPLTKQVPGRQCQGGNHGDCGEGGGLSPPGHGDEDAGLSAFVNVVRIAVASAVEGRSLLEYERDVMRYELATSPVQRAPLRGRRRRPASTASSFKLEREERAAEKEPPFLLPARCESGRGRPLSGQNGTGGSRAPRAATTAAMQVHFVASSSPSAWCFCWWAWRRPSWPPAGSTGAGARAAAAGAGAAGGGTQGGRQARCGASARQGSVAHRRAELVYRSSGCSSNGGGGRGRIMQLRGTHGLQGTAAPPS